MPACTDPTSHEHELNIRLNPDQLAAANHRASQAGMSVSSWLRGIVEFEVERREAEGA